MFFHTSSFAPQALFLPSLGMGELLLILAIVLLLFGPGKLPQVAQSLGEAMQRFKNGTAKKLESPAIEPQDGVTESSSKPDSKPE